MMIYKAMVSFIGEHALRYHDRGGCSGAVWNNLELCEKH